MNIISLSRSLHMIYLFRISASNSFVNSILASTIEECATCETNSVEPWIGNNSKAQKEKPKSLPTINTTMLFAFYSSVSLTMRHTNVNASRRLTSQRITALFNSLSLFSLLYILNCKISNLHPKLPIFFNVYPSLKSSL